MIKLIWEEGIYNHNEVFNFSGTHDFKMEIDMADVNAAEEFCIYQSAFGCLPEFEEECKNIMFENSLLLPTNHSEALALYEWLVSYFNA